MSKDDAKQEKNPNRLHERIRPRPEPNGIIFAALRIVGERGDVVARKGKIMAVNSTRVQFSGALGAKLIGHLDSPTDRPQAYALFAHCFTCSKDLKATRRICRTLAEKGIAILRFDFTGLGESEGEFTETDFSSNIGDLVAAAKFLREEYRAPQLLIGHSLGGTAVLVAAQKIPEIEAVATIAAPAGTDHLRNLLVNKAADLETADEAEIELAGRKFTIRKQLLDDLENHKVSDAIADLEKPLLVYHSPLDNIVGIDQARQIFDAAKHPKSFLSLENADHLLLNNPKDAEFVGRSLACWATRYVTLENPVAEAALGEEGWVVAEGPSSGYQTRITAGPHEFLADEPVTHGGEDRGPNPYQLLLASLGACTTMTLRMYADRKNWPLREARVELKHSRIHAADCADCESTEGRVDVIERRISLSGDLSDEQRQRLLEIADRCPVSKTLTSEIKVRSELAED